MRKLSDSQAIDHLVSLGDKVCALLEEKFTEADVYVLPDGTTLVTQDSYAGPLPNGWNNWSAEERKAWLGKFKPISVKIVNGKIVE